MIVDEVNVPLKACVGSTLALRTSISFSSSAIAVETVDAEVPIAPAVIVPSSASSSLTAATTLLLFEVVNDAISPISS